MKKLVSLMVMLTLVCTCLMPVEAKSEALTKVQQYWLNNPELAGVDQIITVEALGLDVEDVKNHFNVSYDFKNPVDTYGYDITYQEMECGYLAKHIMALAAMKIDPAKFELSAKETIDLIALLKSKIAEDGSVEYGQGNMESSIVYTMFALAIVEPDDDLNSLGAKLASLQLEEGCWGYNGQWGGPDITGWAIGALATCGDTYKAAIDRGIEYLKSIQIENGGYDNYGVNCNSQASAIWGLLEYDLAGVQAGMYNQNDSNPYDLLLQFMLEDGSFATTLTGTNGNLFASIQAGLAVGIYENGSLIKNIASQYQELLNPGQKPIIPTPLPDTSESKDDSITSVKTDDEGMLTVMLSALIISGSGYFVVKKNRKKPKMA